jgi:hypothetical protein
LNDQAMPTNRRNDSCFGTVTNSRLEAQIKKIAVDNRFEIFKRDAPIFIWF